MGDATWSVWGELRPYLNAASTVARTQAIQKKDEARTALACGPLSFVVGVIRVDTSSRRMPPAALAFATTPVLGKEASK
jgi:hypothetical protein